MNNKGFENYQHMKHKKNIYMLRSEENSNIEKSQHI